MRPRFREVVDLYRLYEQLLVNRRGVFLVLAGLVALQSLLDAFGLVLLVPLVEGLQGVQSSSHDILGSWLPGSPQGLAVVVLVTYVLKNAFSLARIWGVSQFVFGLWQRWVERIVEGILYAHEPMPSDTKPGEIVATALSEAYQCAYALVNLLRLLSGILAFVAIYTVLALSSWRITCGMTILFALAFPMVRPLTRRSQRAGSEQVKALEKATSFLMEPAQAQREIQSYGAESFFMDRLRKPIVTLRRSYRTIVSLGEIPFPLLETMTVTAFCLAILGMGRFSPSRLEASLPLLALFGAATFRLYPVLTALGQHWIALTSRQLSIRRVLDAMAADTATAGGGAELAFEKSFVFDRVYYAYEERAVGVDEVSFELPVGQRLGLAGGSGAGKSTLVALLMGFLRPARGEIRVDGRPLQAFEIARWRKGIGYVSQESRQFDLSVAENVTLGRIPVDDERVRSACKAVGIHELIESLPDGYQTRFGERGLSLSGGQRQRLSLARAIVMRPRLLVLDEALSALDSASVLQVLSGIRDYLPNATWVMVAHRLSMLEGFDRVLVFRDGRILQEGSHQTLVASDGYFRRLVELERSHDSEPQAEALAEPEHSGSIETE